MGLKFNIFTGNFDIVSVETVPTGANPTASVGLAAVNGSATTFLRSDGAPALDVGISPTWTGSHIWSKSTGDLVRANSSGTARGLVLRNTGTNKAFIIDEDLTNANTADATVAIQTASVVDDAGTYTKSDTVLEIQSTVIETSGTITDTAKVLEIKQLHTDASGDVVHINNDGTGNAINIANSGGGNALVIDNGNIVMGDNSTTGITFYNTADQTTNFEKVTMSWVANVFDIGVSQGGSGSGRDLIIGTKSRRLLFDENTSAYFYKFDCSTSTTGSWVGIAGTPSNSSGTTNFLGITPTLNQSSTAGYNALLINPTETATGSGDKNLILAQVGDVDKFVVDNAGAITATSYGGILEANLLDKTAAESITGVYTHENQIIIDTTDTEAFLVRRNGDARDVFTIDTTNEDIIVGDGSLSGDRIVEMYNENTRWGAYGFDDSAGYFGIRVGDSTFNAATAELSIDLNKLGFFNQAPVAQPTGVAVTAAGIHSALVTLGLITA